jgi:hypothetical protein
MTSKPPKVLWVMVTPGGEPMGVARTKEEVALDAEFYAATPHRYVLDEPKSKARKGRAKR